MKNNYADMRTSNRTNSLKWRIQTEINFKLFALNNNIMSSATSMPSAEYLLNIKIIKD